MTDQSTQARPRPVRSVLNRLYTMLGPKLCDWEMDDGTIEILTAEEVKERNRRAS